MTDYPKIAVLLPTYNGERFLAQQLDSLIAQHAVNLVIVTRDDGSTDATRGIVAGYASDYPGLLHIVGDDGSNLGPCGNFSLLMQYVLDNRATLGLSSAYLMLCDQDDVWAPDKARLQLAAMLAKEASNPGMPVLVHSDLTVVDASGEPIAESFLRYQGLDASRNDLRNIIFSNTVTGCTALLNEPLARKALPVPDGALMHDWWLALVAAAFGTIHFVPQQLVRYRQHGQNALGAREYVPPRLLSRSTFNQLLRKNPEPLLFAVAEQAGEFARCYGRELSPLNRLQLGLARRLRTESFLLQRILFRLLRF